MIPHLLRYKRESLTQFGTPQKLEGVVIDGKEADFCFFKLLELPDLNVRYSPLNLANDLLSRGMVAMQEMRDEERKGYSSDQRVVLLGFLPFP